MSENKLSASQRIENLEKGLMSTYQTVDMIARDLTVLKDAIKLLGNKIDAVVKAVASGSPLTDEAISKLMIANNVEELAQKVTELVAQGILAHTDTISATSFLVGQEIDSESAVANPRLQFAVSALGKELQDKLIGRKVGDLVDLQEGKLKFEVLEVYSIQAPSAPSEAPATEVAAPESAETPAEEAPAQSSA